MSRNEIYQKRINQFRKNADLLQKRENSLSLARLICFAGGLVFFFSLFSYNLPLAFTGLLISWIVFAGLVKFHTHTGKEKQLNRILETINEKEKRSLDGDFLSYPDGHEYMNAEHPNSSDLDLFGHASLFQFVNRTTSRPAADLLAEWLKTPASQEIIQLRQQAVCELSPRIEWRQNLIKLGYENGGTERNPEQMLSWAQHKPVFKNPVTLKIITYSFSLLAFASLAAVFFGMPLVLLIPVFAINFLFYFLHSKNINTLHNQVGKYAAMLELYSSTIRLIENESFDSDLLKALHIKFSGSQPASEIVRQLSRLVSRLDVRLNVMVSVPLNALVFWDVHCCLALEKWKTVHRQDIENWLSAMSAFEVLSSFANMAYNNPTWGLPVIVPHYFEFTAGKMGHPLIPEKRRVVNDLCIAGDGRTIIVTGSNMAGKSTFLRTCGINSVLAMAGAPVCAESFAVSNVPVYTSMRISDSLEDNTSSFYAELKKLAFIIRHAKQNPHIFLLLDEILRGTNSNDRYTGSVALIKQLTGYGTVSMIATHDLKLAGLENTLKGHIDNYHFDVKIEGEELFFDYKLNKGVCTSMNASILMKKMGIEME